MSVVETVAVAGPPPLPADSTATVLAPEQLGELAAANRRARKVINASRVAMFNGWTVGLAASVSVIFALFSIPTAILTAGLGLVSWNEFRGRKRFLRFDPRAARLLGWNQLALLAMVVAYCGWHVGVALLGPGPYDEVLRANPEMKGMLGSINDLHVLLTVAVYSGVAVFSALFQALTSAYYFTRAGHVRAYLEQTPPWVVDLQRRTVLG